MNETAVYSLENPGGVRVGLSAMGASIREVVTPDRAGRFVNVALPQTIPPHGSYAGATLAPFAGRIRGGLLPVEGGVWRLALNDGPNQLHGGPHNLANVRWKTEGARQEAGFQSIRFFAEAAHGLDGFPGNRAFAVTYRLWEDNRLEILLYAESDRSTRMSLSNHAYWNLSGDFSHAPSGQLLQIAAERVYWNDGAHLPMEKRPVGGTPFDFRAPAPLVERVSGNHPQLAIARGFNHAFALNAPDGTPAATLTDPRGGRRLRLYTDQPVLWLYSGGYLPVPSCAVALEAEGTPDGPGELVAPGRPYSRRICFVFDTAAAPEP